MWYVMQVRTGTEETIRKQCERQISRAVLRRSFIPYYEEKKKYEGEWHIRERVLFPGYVFLVAEEVGELIEGLKRVVGLTKLLSVGDDIIPLSAEEVAFLLKMGGEEQLMCLSTGIIEGDRVQVLSGPLKGMESSIRKIDRHKRKAWLEVRMFGRTVEMQMGLEILWKKESGDV